MKHKAQRFHEYMRTHSILKYPYKGIVIIVGILCIILGIFMLVLPGPGLLTIFLGLILLSTEIPIFKRLTDYLHQKFIHYKAQFTKKSHPPDKLNS